MATPPGVFQAIEDILAERAKEQAKRDQRDRLKQRLRK